MSGKPNEYYVRKPAEPAEPAEPADVDRSALREIVVDKTHSKHYDGYWNWKLKDGNVKDAYGNDVIYKSTTHYDGAELFLVKSKLSWVVAAENPILAGHLVVLRQEHADGYSYDHNYIRPIELKPSH